MKDVGAGLFPLDKQLGLSESLYSERLVGTMVWLSGLLPYAQAQAVFERIGKRLIPTSSIWRKTQVHGAQLRDVVEQDRRQVALGQTRLNAASLDHPHPKGVSMDGGTLNIRGEGWKEMKVGAVYDVQQRLERDVRTQEWTEQAHASHITYTAVLGDVNAFAPALWQLASVHDVPNAAHSSVTADGAEWIWNVAADYFPDSTQIVDWFHAKQHLSDAAQALFPENNHAAAAWLAQRTDDLFAGAIHCITASLDNAALADHSRYFHHHKRRMQYHEFRENGLPIGSGTVESAVKQFKARLSASGMRWNRPSAQSMLVIRAAVLDGSFDTLWRRIA